MRNLRKSVLDYLRVLDAHRRVQASRNSGTTVDEVSYHAACLYNAETDLRLAAEERFTIGVGDQVRPTEEARRFLAKDAIRTPSEVVELHGDCARLDPPAPDFTPNGVPAAWLERVP